MTKKQLQRLNEERVAVKRVLQMVDRFLKAQKQDLLVCEAKSGGLLTWGEIRAHIHAAIATTLLRRALKR